jgi:hypothetical protein
MTWQAPSEQIRHKTPLGDTVGGPANCMRIVGGIEIFAGFLVAIKPKFGAPVVAAWLFGIIVNLLLVGSYFDIALRDFAHFLGALALFRLGVEFDHGKVEQPSTQ